APGVAGGQYSWAMLLQDSLANAFGRVENSSSGSGAAKWRSQGDDRSDISWPLARHRACDHPSEAVADQVTSPLGFGQGSLYGLVQLALDQEIRALGIDTDAGKIRPVSDALQPAVEFH